MTTQLKVLVGIDAGVEPEMLGSIVDAQASIELVRPAGDLVDAWESLEADVCDLLIVACTGDGERALSFISATVQQSPRLPIVAFYQGDANGFVAEAFRAGADEVLVLPSGPDADADSPSTGDVLFTLQKAVARRNGGSSGASGGHSRTVCVLGPKGGIGKTVVASNLGVTLASQGSSVAMVDLDLQFGDLGLALDLRPDKTIHDLATSGGALDAEKLVAFMTPHKSGARVLMAPTRPDQAGSITADFLHRIYALLRGMYEYVIVDTAPGFPAEVIASIDTASDVCMVATLDVLSLKSTKVGLETLRMMGYDLDRVRIVLNRADSRVGLTHDDVKTVLGRDPDVLVPSHRDVTRSLNDAAPLVMSAPRSEVARALVRLGALYQPAENGSSRRVGRRGRRRR